MLFFPARACVPEEQLCRYDQLQIRTTYAINRRQELSKLFVTTEEKNGLLRAAVWSDRRFLAAERSTSLL